MEKSKLHFDKKANCWRDKNSRKYYFKESCAVCGKPFYGKADAIYCSHKCFINGNNPAKSDANKERMRIRMSSNLNPTKRPEIARKISIAMTKPKPAPTLCECGCGKYAKPVRRFIQNHKVKGIKRPFISELMKLRNPMSNPESRKAYDIACANKDYQTISEKTKQTMMEKYGVENYSQTKQFRESFRGENHPGWKGGIAPERQNFYNSQEWKDACCIVWGRDSSTCHRCGVTQEKNGDGSFHIHHIVSFMVEELRADPDNMILLCADCHYWVHSNENVNNDFIGDIQDEKIIAYA